MFELPDPLAVRVVLRGLLVLAAAEEVGILVIEPSMVAGEVPVMGTSS